MDEQERPEVDTARIAAVFRDAAGAAPPAGFDAGDVVAASRRITRRRRSAVAGAALAVLALAGVGVTVGFADGGSETATATAGSAAGAAAPEAAPAVPEAAAGADDARSRAGDGSGADASRFDAVPTGPVPGPSGIASGAVPPVGTPLGPGTRGCADRQDPALRGLVEQVLPEVVGAPEAAVTTECRPGGERGLALEVRDGAATGVLTIRYLPPGEHAVPPGAAALEEPAGVAPTASGGEAVVQSRATRRGDPAPFADRVDAVVAHLAPRL